MDEPTNHLDLAALEWLETYLLNWKGAMVIVAHDRYFLDKIVSKTIEMAFGRIEEYPGNYTKYLSLREERMERQQREYEAPASTYRPYRRIYPSLQSWTTQ